MSVADAVIRVDIVADGLDSGVEVMRWIFDTIDWQLCENRQEEIDHAVYFHLEGRPGELHEFCSEHFFEDTAGMVMMECILAEIVKRMDVTDYWVVSPAFVRTGDVLDHVVIIHGCSDGVEVFSAPQTIEADGRRVLGEWCSQTSSPAGRFVRPAQFFPGGKAEVISGRV